jgi:hypothetical protein
MFYNLAAFKKRKIWEIMWVRIPARHPSEALYWAKSNEETRVDLRRMDGWMSVLYEKNIENKQKEWLMPPNL